MDVGKGGCRGLANSLWKSLDEMMMLDQGSVDGDGRKWVILRSSRGIKPTRHSSGLLQQ